MTDSTIDFSIIGKILLREFNEMNSKKFKLAAIYALMGGRTSKIYTFSGKVLKPFKNKRKHPAFFKIKIDEAINSLIASSSDATYALFQ